jgi:hypothetical protein
MSRENLVRDLERLRSEIDGVARNNPDAYRKLNELINDLERQVSESPDSNHVGLSERVKDELVRFEAAHPRATAILNDILVTLGNMGI